METTQSTNILVPGVVTPESVAGAHKGNTVGRAHGCHRREGHMTAFASSLKATERRRETEDDPIAGLERAQADYDAADAGFRARQREILQEVFRSVTGLIGDDETRCTFMDDEAIAQYVGHKADRGDVWFYALAYVYRATSRAKRQRASKHAAALRLLYSENVETDEIAATIKKRGGIRS